MVGDKIMKALGAVICELLKSEALMDRLNKRAEHYKEESHWHPGLDDTQGAINHARSLKAKDLADRIDANRHGESEKPYEKLYNHAEDHLRSLKRKGRYE